MPTLVVGLGRFGLACLEEIHDAWALDQGLDDDPSRSNLRLVWAHGGQDGKDGVSASAWRGADDVVATLAHRLGVGELPTRMLDFLLLRTLGVVRLRGRTFELAEPELLGVQSGNHVVDVGVANLRGTAEPVLPVAARGWPGVGLSTSLSEGDGAVGAGVEAGKLAFRRVRLRWTCLGHDPVEAAHRVADLRRQRGPAESFIGSMLETIHDGRLPQSLQAAWLRCLSWREGLDPSPWQWQDDADAGHFGESTGDEPASAPTDDVDLAATAPGDAWSRWEAAFQIAPAEPPRDGCPRIAVLREDPSRFAYHQNMERSALRPPDPRMWLGASGLSSSGLRSRDVGRLRVIPARWATHGLYDRSHDLDFARTGPGSTAHLAERFKVASELAEAGLLRLWNALRAEAGTSDERFHADGSEETVEGRAELSESVHFLGEVVVAAAVAREAQGDPQTKAPLLQTSEHQQDPWVDGDDLPPLPSERLRRATARRAVAHGGEQDAFERRLASLGLADAAQGREQRVFTEHRFSPDDFKPNASIDETQINDPRRFEHPALLDLRADVQRVLSQLFHVQHLRQVRVERSGPPPLQVFVLADLGEAFGRRALATVLDEIAAEAARALRPLVLSEQGALPNGIRVLPVVWLPNPSAPDQSFGHQAADQTGALSRAAREAILLDAVQAVQRRQARLPLAHRVIRQLFFNGRTTDAGIFGRRDAVRQTRDFLRLCSRYDLHADEGLRRLFQVAQQDGTLATFACRAIEVPTRQIERYGANLLARRTIDALATSQVLASVDIEVPDLASAEELVAQTVAETTKAFVAVADAARAEVKAKGPSRYDHEVRSEVVEAAYDARYEAALANDLGGRWRASVESGGRFTEQLHAVRKASGDHAELRVVDVRRLHDEGMSRYAPSQGLDHLRARWQSEARSARVVAAEREDDRAKRESAMSGSRPPVRLEGRLASGFEAVRRAAAAKPAWNPVAHALVGMAVFVPWLAAALPWSVSLALGLDKSGGPLEVVLAVVGPIVVGAAALFGLLAFARHVLTAYAKAIEAAVDALGTDVAGVLHGDEHQGPWSFSRFVIHRIRMLGALAAHRLADRVTEVYETDVDELERARRALLAQRTVLEREVESMGVRRAGAAGAPEDVRGMLSSIAGNYQLVDVGAAVAHVTASFSKPSDLSNVTQRMLRTVVEVERWRTGGLVAAPEAWTRAARPLLERGEGPLVLQESVGRTAVDRLSEFLAESPSHLGFGADYDGREGFESEPVAEVAPGELIGDAGVLRELWAAVESGSRSITTPLRPRPLPKFPTDIVIALRATVGIPVSAVRNTRRYESDLDRASASPRARFPYEHPNLDDEVVLGATPMPRFAAWRDRMTGPVTPAGGSETSDLVDDAESEPVTLAEVLLDEGPSDTATGATEGEPPTSEIDALRGRDTAVGVADVEAGGGDDVDG
jgi:type IV secretory pathway VirB2 component (pilin)